MKSIFKKIAFVLALAMVVTAFPAKTAAAADEPWLKSYRVLYIGGDKLGDYAESAWASVKKGDYSVAFASQDENIVTVNPKNGRLHAVSVGNTVVTATFSKDGEKDIVKECKVVVKKNADSAVLSAESEAAVKELVEGDTLELTAVLTDANGSNDDITDTVRYESDNKEVLTIGYKDGKLTAVGAGTATIKVYAIQWDYSKADKKYVQTTTTQVAKYEVSVKKASIKEAKQIASDTVAITCDTEAVASAIAKNPESVKTTYNSGDVQINAFVKSAAVDANDKKVVNVTMFSSFTKAVTYNFTYGDATCSIVGADLDAIDSIKIATVKALKGELTDITVDAYDANGVKIQSNVAAVITALDTNSTDYFLSGNSIYFADADKTAKIKATLDMGYDANGNKNADKTVEGTIVSYANAADVVGGITWSLGDVNVTASALSYADSVNSIAVGDAKQLYGKYVITNYAGTATNYYTDSSKATEEQVGVSWKFTSTNTAVVMVDEATGHLYPVAAGKAQIVLEKSTNGGNSYATVAACVITVVDSRRLNTFTAEALWNNKLSSTDTVNVAVDPKDQLNEAANVKYSARLLDNHANVVVKMGTVTLGSTSEDVTLQCKASAGWTGYRPYFEIKATGTTETTAKTVRVEITAVDANNANNKISKVVILQVKQAAATGASGNYVEMSAGKDAIDMNLNVDNKVLADYTATFEVKEKDAQGFYVGNVELIAAGTEVASGAALAEGNKGKYFATITAPGGNEGTTTATKFEAVTASGSAATKAKTGTYVIRFYKVVEVKKNSSKIYEKSLVAVKSIVVSDSTASVTVKQVANKLTTIDNANAIAALEFYRGTDKLSTVEATVPEHALTVNADATNGYLSKVKLTETGKAKTAGDGSVMTYEYEVIVNKSFTK